MIAAKQVTRTDLQKPHFEALATAIGLEANMMDVTISNVTRKTRDARTGPSITARLYALSEAGLIETQKHDIDGIKHYRVTQAGYARAGVKPPLWVA